MTPPGWYQDPDGGGWRWWDGAAWGPLYDFSQIRNPTVAAPGRSIGLLDLKIDPSVGWAARLTRVVAVGAGCALVIAGAVLVHTYLVGPVPVALMTLLAVPAVPLLIVGQLWTIAILTRRANERRRAAGDRHRWWRSSSRLSDVRGGLPWPALVLAGVLFYGVFIVAGPLSWVWGATSAELPGVPTEDPSLCEHSWNNHGDYRCLSDAEHEQEVVTTQRFATAVVFAFFVAHCTVASGAVLERRR